VEHVISLILKPFKFVYMLNIELVYQVWRN